MTLSLDAWFLQSTQERPPNRANVSHANGNSRNKDGFSSNNNYNSNYRRGDRDQNRDRGGYSNNRDHNPSYRRKGPGEYRPNNERTHNGAYRQRQQADAANTSNESPPQSSPMTERPKLELKPRTTPLETGHSRDPNIFGIGKARESHDDLESNNLETNGQTDIDKDVTMESQSRMYVNKGKFSADRKFNQDKFKGGGKGYTKGRDRKPRNTEKNGIVSHQKVNVPFCLLSYVLFHDLHLTLLCLINNRHPKRSTNELIEHPPVNHPIYLKT